MRAVRCILNIFQRKRLKCLLVPPHVKEKMYNQNWKKNIYRTRNPPLFHIIDRNRWRHLSLVCKITYECVCVLGQGFMYSLLVIQIRTQGGAEYMCMPHVNQTPLKVPRPSQEVAMAIRIEFFHTFLSTKAFFITFKMFSFFIFFLVVFASRPILTILLTRQKWSI